MNGRNVHLFVFDSMADWEASFAVAGINNPQFQREPGRYRVDHRWTHHADSNDHGRPAHPTRHQSL